MDAARSTVPTKRNWFARNWKWLVPSGCLVILTGVILFAGVVFFAVSSIMKESDAYKLPVARARENPSLIAAIGTPMREGKFASGSTNVSGPSGQASLAIPISGPKGKATVYVEATKSAGVWRFETLVAQVEKSGERIN